MKTRPITRGTNLPASEKPNPASDTPGSIKRRKFLGLGLSGFAGFSLPKLFQAQAKAADEKPKAKAVDVVPTTKETAYWERTDRFEEKMSLLAAAWQKKDFRLILNTCPS